MSLYARLPSLPTIEELHAERRFQWWLQAYIAAVTGCCAIDALDVNDTLHVSQRIANGSLEIIEHKFYALIATVQSPASPQESPSGTQGGRS
jgi:hypothetical protein